MDITPFLESLRGDLRNAADAAGEDGRAAAERMLLALEPAFRLAVMEALSQAAAEITAELPAGVVEVRLRGRDPEIHVDVPATQSAEVDPASGAPDSSASSPGGPDDEEEDGVIARVTVRIPESVKTRAEELASRSGHSLNAWIVHALRIATSASAARVDLDLSSLPFGDDRGTVRPSPRRMSGWA